MLSPTGSLFLLRLLLGDVCVSSSPFARFLQIRLAALKTCFAIFSSEKIDLTDSRLDSDISSMLRASQVNKWVLFISSLTR